MFQLYLLALVVLYGPNEDAPELFKNILKHIEMLGNESDLVLREGGLCSA